MLETNRTKMALLLLSIYVASLIAASAAVPAPERNGPVVQTNFGAVRGASRVYEERPYDVFLGVPFGSAGEGSKRWTVTEYPSSWEGELETTEFGLYCKQLITPLYPLIGMKGNDSEDCLFLNIYVPNGIQKKREQNLPVIFFIYGGGFLIGASDMYPAEDLALNTDTIVVTINYRVAPLGFLSAGNDNAPGNYGLRDAYLALRWVNENIGFFGGDTSRITVMGQSAGGGSASLLALSPYTNGLFQRYVAISGSSTSWFSITNNLPQTVRNTALMFGCNIFNPEAMLECLREKSATALDIFGIVAPLLLGGTIPNWVPVVDQDFVVGHPRDQVSEGVNAHLDAMVGYARHDGAGFIYLNFLGYDIGDTLNIAKNKDLLFAILRLMMTTYEDPDGLVEIVTAQYPDLNSDDAFNRTQAAVQTLTDFVFASPIHYEAEHHSRGESQGSTYLYEFAHRQSFLQYEDWVQGSHVDDMHSYFGPVFLQQFREGLLGTEWNDDDRAVSKNLQNYLANFVATGNPNEGPNTVPVNWPEYNEEERQYIVQDEPYSVTSQSDDMLNRFNFWVEFYDNVRFRPAAKTISPDVERLLMLLRPRLLELVQIFPHFAENPEDFLAFLKNVARNLIENY